MGFVRAVWLLTGLLLLLALAPAAGAEEPPPDDELDAIGFGEDEAEPDAPDDRADPDDIGFGEEAAGTEDEAADPFDFDTPPGAAPAPPEPTPWSLTGFLRSDEALWLERFKGNPLAKARQSLDLALGYKRGILRLRLAGHGELDLAYQVQRDTYDDPTLDAYEWQIALRDAFIALSLGRFELTVGRQIVAWGEGDALSPLDVVNPRDYREPGLADLDDLRTSVLATRLGWFSGPHRLELMLIHETDFGYRPAPLSDYSPFRSAVEGSDQAELLIAGRDVRFRDRQPRFALDQQVPLLRWVYKGEGVDVGLQAAWILDPQGVVQLDLEALTDPEEIAIGLDHRRTLVLGHSGARPAGDFLIKWELGAQLGREATTGDLDGDPDNAAAALASLGSAKVHVVDTMVGVTWTGLTDLTVALEVHKPWLIDDPGDLLIDLSAPTFALRLSWLTLRQRLRLDAAWSMLGWTANQGWFARAQASWELRDALSLTGGLVTYHPGDDFGPLTGLDRHDRLFVGLRWDFQIL